MKHLPNFITCINLFCGSVACIAALKGWFEVSAILMACSLIADFLDGFFARLLKAYSAIGKELDSLADLISFGLVPSLLAYKVLETSLGDSNWLIYTPLIIAVFSGLRLAMFNVDERQTTSFIGLPTPANAILWLGLTIGFNSYFLTNPYLLICIAAVTSYLLVSPIPLMSLKGWSIRQTALVTGIILIIAVTIVLNYFFPESIENSNGIPSTLIILMQTLPKIIIYYIIISLLFHQK